MKSLMGLIALTAMVFRGMLPTGYMLGSSAELAAGSPLAICPVQSRELSQILAAQPAANTAAAHERHVHHHHHGAGPVPASTEQAGDAAPSFTAQECVYALALGAGVAPWVAPIALDFVSAVRAAPAVVARIHAAPRRAYSARGPPRLA